MLAIVMMICVPILIAVAFQVWFAVPAAMIADGSPQAALLYVAVVWGVPLLVLASLH